MHQPVRNPSASQDSQETIEALPRKVFRPTNNRTKIGRTLCKAHSNRSKSRMNNDVAKGQMSDIWFNLFPWNFMKLPCFSGCEHRPRRGKTHLYAPSPRMASRFPGRVHLGVLGSRPRVQYVQYSSRSTMFYGYICLFLDVPLRLYKNKQKRCSFPLAVATTGTLLPRLLSPLSSGPNFWALRIRSKVLERTASQYQMTKIP